MGYTSLCCKAGAHGVLVNKEDNKIEKKKCKMSKDKVAVCVISTNDSYVYKAIITLLSVREKNEENKNFEYFVCGNISDKYKRVIEEYNLGVLKIDLKNIFGGSKGFIWPNECFWSCAIPEAFYKKGFSYSIVLDGDIFCIGKVPMNIIEEVEELALRIGTKGQAFLRKIMKKFNFRQKDIEECWMSSGTIIFNNKNLTRKKFKEEFINLYRDLSKISYFEADETVFFFLRIKGLFNFYDLRVKWNGPLNTILPDSDLIFLHITSKPWHYRFLWEKLPDSNDIGVEIHKKRRIKYREFYINFCKKIYGHKFYWYYISDVIPIKKIIKKSLVRLLYFFSLKKIVRDFLS